MTDSDLDKCTGALANARQAIAAMENAMKEFANAIDIVLINVDTALDCIRARDLRNAEKNIRHLREILKTGQKGIREAPSPSRPN